VITAYAVSYGGFQLVTGPLGDRYGKVRMVALSAVLSGLFTFACAFTTSLEQISILRFLAGLTGAAIIPNCIAFI
ncbi:MFS transporter, partial [Stenotrophomonas maltophilia]|uniref:MFS transporter n=1 Tax=Stenotrophomonas maltophilia TaxID=40324 RepID=UPI0013DCBF8D